MSSGALPDDPETLKAMLLAERVQNERLRQIIKELRRHRFGRRAETLPEDQMLLGLEDVEQTAASAAATADQLAPPGLQSAAPPGAPCRRICRGSRSSSISTTKFASVAWASCTGSARTKASDWTLCRPSSGYSSPAVQNTPAGVAKMASCRLRRSRV